MPMARAYFFSSMICTVGIVMISSRALMWIPRIDAATSPFPTAPSVYPSNQHQCQADACRGEKKRLLAQRGKLSGAEFCFYPEGARLSGRELAQRDNQGLRFSSK